MTALIANATTTANADSLSLAEIMASYITQAVYSMPGIRSLIRTESLAGQPSDTKKFPAWPALAAAAVAETADLANTAIVPTEVLISVGEIGIMATLSDAQTEDDIVSGLDGYTTQLARAIVDKREADVAALFSGFSTAVGDTTNGLSQEDVLLATRELDAIDAPRNGAGSYNGVLHPVQMSQLGLDIVTNGGQLWAGDTPQDGRFGPAGTKPFFGVNFMPSTNTPTNTRTNAVYDGAIFSPEALAEVSKREARVEFDRDPSFRLTEIVVTARYGVGELVDDWGVALYSRTTAS